MQVACHLRAMACLMAQTTTLSGPCTNHTINGDSLCRPLTQPQAHTLQPTGMPSPLRHSDKPPGTNGSAKGGGSAGHSKRTLSPTPRPSTSLLLSLAQVSWPSMRSRQCECTLVHMDKLCSEPLLMAPVAAGMLSRDFRTWRSFRS